MSTLRSRLRAFASSRETQVLGGLISAAAMVAAPMIYADRQAASSKPEASATVAAQTLRTDLGAARACNGRAVSTVDGRTLRVYLAPTSERGTAGEPRMVEWSAGPREALTRTVRSVDPASCAPTGRDLEHDVVLSLEDGGVGPVFTLTPAPCSEDTPAGRGECVQVRYRLAAHADNGPWTTPVTGLVAVPAPTRSA